MKSGGSRVRSGFGWFHLEDDPILNIENQWEQLRVDQRLFQHLVGYATGIQRGLSGD